MSSFLKYKLELNFLIYLFGKIISAGLIILSIPLFITYFGVKVYGDFILYYTSFLMLYAGSSGWVVQGILRFYTLEKDPKKIANDVFQSAFKSFLFSSVILSVVFYYYDASLFLIIVAVLSLYFGILYSVKLAITQALLKSKEFIITDIIRTATYFGIPFGVQFLFPNLEGILALFIGVLFSYILGNLWLNKFRVIIPKVNFKKTRWGNIFFKYGFPLSIWMMFSPTTNGVDRYIIEYNLGVIALAKYAAIFDIVFKVFSNLSVPFNNIVQPLLINSFNNKDFKEYSKIMGKALVYLSILFAAVFVGVMLLQEYLICNYLGFCEDSLELSKLIFPFIFSSYIWQLSILIQKNLEVNNRTIEMTIYMLIVVAITIVLGLIFVPIYGMIAAAYVSLFSAMIYFVLVIYGTKKHFKR